MIVAVGVDHAGAPLRGAMVETLRALGHAPLELAAATARVSDEPRNVRRRERVQELERRGLDADLGDSTTEE